MAPTENPVGQPETLTDLRNRIDAVDAELIDLLARRQQIVEQVGVIKRGQPTSAVHAPDRRRAIITARRDLAATAGLDPDVAEAIWNAMIDAFTALELRIHAG